MISLLKRGKLSSRRQIQIKEVKDTILVLPQNHYRLILETSSLNFELKSEAEQDVIIDSFQTFLNALPDTVQILVRVREVDIDAYVKDLQKLKEKEVVPAYQKHIDDYCTFVKKLVSGNKILSRRFYIIIPYHHPDRHQDWNVIKEHLHLSADIIIKGLERMQMKARIVTGLEVLNLLYAFYNPASLKTQSLTKETLDALLKHTYV